MGADACERARALSQSAPIYALRHRRSAIVEADAPRPGRARKVRTHHLLPHGWEGPSAVRHDARVILPTWAEQQRRGIHADSG